MDALAADSGSVQGTAVNLEISYRITVATMKTSTINNSISYVTQACSICRLCSSDCRCHVVLVERDVIFGDTIWEEPCGDAMDCNGWTCECSTRDSIDY